MFRRFCAAVRALIPKRHKHQWKESSVRYNPLNKSYWTERWCETCPRKERRKHVAGPRRGDAREIYPDPYSGWEPIRGTG